MLRHQCSSPAEGTDSPRVRLRLSPAASRPTEPPDRCHPRPATGYRTGASSASASGRSQSDSIYCWRIPSDRRPLAIISRRSGASTRTIERLFVDSTGMTFGKWRQQLRLLGGGAKVTLAALEAEYSTPSAFPACSGSVEIEGIRRSGRHGLVFSFIGEQKQNRFHHYRGVARGCNSVAVANLDTIAYTRYYILAGTKNELYLLSIASASMRTKM